MAREKLRITKEWLQQHGIVDVSKDGVVTGVKGEKKVFTITTKHPYGKDKSYHAITVYDSDLYKEKGYGGIRTLLLSRVMYAWYHDVCPEDFDVDHIDNNSLNDTLDNLRLLSRGDNNRRHKPRNKILANIPEEELEKYFSAMKNFEEECNKTRAKIYNLKAYKLYIENELKYIKSEFKKQELKFEAYLNLTAYWKDVYDIAKNDLKIERDNLSELKKHASEFKDKFLKNHANLSL
jgi:hypothetical protein